jgi:hypothetical protein
MISTGNLLAKMLPIKIKNRLLLFHNKPDGASPLEIIFNSADDWALHATHTPSALLAEEL